MEYRLNELIVILATLSLVSWSAVGITALLRAGAQLRYRRRQARTRIRQRSEEAAD